MTHSVLRGLIFDLDMTLVDSSKLEQLRRARKWDEVYSRLSSTHLFYGIEPLLSELILTYQMGIVTSSPRPYAEKLIAHHHLPLNVLVAYHDTFAHKPDPQPLNKAISMLGMRNSEVLSVGDEVRDVIASHRAGIRCVAVTWGLATKKELLQAEAEFVVTSVQELSDLLVHH